LHASRLGLAGAGVPLAMYAFLVCGLRIIFLRLPDQIGAARLSGAALSVSALGMLALGILPGQAGLYVGTAVFATGIAFMFPALIAVAVSRVDESERGSVVGTSSAFLDLGFGLSPAVLGAVANTAGYPAAWLFSAVVAGLGAMIIAVTRRSLAAVVPERA
jgi:MFS family permease